MGITTVVHIIIIGIWRLLKALDAKSKVAYAIVGVILLLVSTSVATIVHGALADENANHRLVSRLIPCVPFEQKATYNKVVFRIDDIQAHAYTGVQIRMMEDAFAQEIPLLLGVIPKGITEDPRIFRFLKENVCRVEIAQHGWDHNYENGSETPEFENLSKEAAYELITRGKAILKEVTDESIVTFIPPNNKSSAGTIQALVQSGILVSSAVGTGDFDYDATTYSFAESRLVPHQEVVSQCEKSFAKDGLCIIMLHPQDYMIGDAIDENKYQNYLQLIAALKKKNVSFVTMKDIVDEHGQRKLAEGRLPLSQDRTCNHAIKSEIIAGAKNSVSDVAVLQMALKRFAGFPNLKMTGAYDKETQEAFVSYQLKTGSLSSPRTLGNKLLCEKK